MKVNDYDVLVGDYYSLIGVAKFWDLDNARRVLLKQNGPCYDRLTEKEIEAISEADEQKAMKCLDESIGNIMEVK